MEKKRTKYSVPAIERALSILEYLKDHREASLTEIHNDLSLPKSSTYSILFNLLERGYITRGATGGFKLGLKFYELGIKAIEGINFMEKAKSTMEILAKETGLTCNLGVIEGDVGVYLEKVDSPSPIRLNSWKGKRLPIHCTALGKILLANRELQEREEILDRISLDQFTPHTLTDKHKLMNQLDLFKKQGFSIDAEEHEKDITCFAAPVFNHAGNAVAAISLSGLTVWFDEARKKEIVEKLTLACQGLTEQVGG